MAKYLYNTLVNSMLNKKNCSLLFVIFLGFLSIGWIDPLADKVREGNQLYHNGKYDEALDKYINAQIDLPDASQLDFNVADAQYKRGKYEEATQLFDKGIKSDDAGMRARSSFNMGNALYRQGKMKEALECYKKTVDFAEEAEGKGGSNLETLKNDAKYNYEYVEKKMKEEKQQQQNQDQKDQQQKEDPKKDDKQSEENKGKDKEKERQKPQEKDKEPSEPEDTQEKDRNEEDKHQNQSQQDKQKDQPSEQQQQQLQPQGQKQMSKEEAEQLLEALNQSEKEARAMKRDAQRVQHGSTEKDW
ncbi:MAG: TPR domain protein in aerotolerance operon [Candidatus Jettenia ecosi]|uniref:TPR domain protein in aerotolerance operon n=1 Tax=Candidatus Jettenia ecosi TaxID=2494326 RepID=A0A533QKQ1_9BACT|nr:MAG: TPR domain protein in aerotolerance operon [Candidatus Jettenia ecosi]